MNARDELGKLLFTLPVSDRAADTAPEIMVLCDEAAEAILDAGYRKPRTITTAEELDALPVGSVVLDPAGLSLHKNEFTGWRASNGAKNITTEMLHHEALPATVLHEGTQP